MFNRVELTEKQTDTDDIACLSYRVIASSQAHRNAEKPDPMLGHGKGLKLKWHVCI